MSNNKYPLVEVVYASESPVESSKGSNGYGEGIVYGIEPYSSRPAIYYYRFAGKKIPTSGISYVTCEYGYFSREKGDRSQLIIAYDPSVNGFRLLSHVKHGDRTFKAQLEKFQSFKTVDDAISYAQSESESQKQASMEMKALIESGIDLF